MLTIVPHGIEMCIAGKVKKIMPEDRGLGGGSRGSGAYHAQGCGSVQYLLCYTINVRLSDTGDTSARLE